MFVCRLSNLCFFCISVIDSVCFMFVRCLLNLCSFIFVCRFLNLCYFMFVCRFM